MDGQIWHRGWTDKSDKSDKSFIGKITVYTLVPPGPDCSLGSIFCLSLNHLFLALLIFSSCQNLSPSASSWHMLIHPQTVSNFSHTFLTCVCVGGGGHWELETKTCLSRFLSQFWKKFCKTQMCVPPQLQATPEAWMVTPISPTKDLPLPTQMLWGAFVWKPSPLAIVLAQIWIPSLNFTLWLHKDSLPYPPD